MSTNYQFLIDKYGESNILKFISQLKSQSQFKRVCPKIKYHSSSDNFTLSYQPPIPNACFIRKDFSYLDDLLSIFPLAQAFNISYSLLSLARKCPRKFICISPKKSFLSLSIMLSLSQGV